MKSKMLIGIDPGVKNGFAKLSDSLIELSTLSFWKLINWFDSRKSFFPDMRIHIEDPTANRPVFNRNVGKGSMLKIAQNVGENKCMAKLLFQYFEINGIEYHRHRPTKKSMTKLNAVQFEKVTGLKQRSSEHSRDACMLIWHRR